MLVLFSLATSQFYFRTNKKPLQISLGVTTLAVTARNGPTRKTRNRSGNRLSSSQKITLSTQLNQNSRVVLHTEIKHTKLSISRLHTKHI